MSLATSRFSQNTLEKLIATQRNLLLKKSRYTGHARAVFVRNAGGAETLFPVTDLHLFSRTRPPIILSLVMTAENSATAWPKTAGYAPNVAKSNVMLQTNPT